MTHPSWFGAILLAAVGLATTDVRAFDDAKYPDLKGQWNRAPVPGAVGQPTYDPSKPWGLGQQAPLLPSMRQSFRPTSKTKPPAARASRRGGPVSPTACRPS
jgi:hypothetical protein